MHVWTADTQSAESRLQWRKTLDDMAALHPQQVIPGHYLGLRRPQIARSPLPATICSSLSRR
jgi:hypothetical protein